MESKVFWGVLCALLVFSGIAWAVFALGVFGMRAAAQQAIEQQAAMDARQAAQARAQAEAQRRLDLWHRTLADNQRCYGGAVVQMDGSTYTQLGTISNPIHCTGDLADRPIR